MHIARIALVGDFSPDIIAHAAINESLRLWRGATQICPEWIHTSKAGQANVLDGIAGVWCVPGSPYASTEGALSAIQWARTHGVPFLGTCGGFQHAVLEFVRNELGRHDAGHAELESDSSFAIISPLACSLVEKSQQVIPTGHGRFVQWYGAEPRKEGFHCSFGLNPGFESILEKSGLEVVARSETGEVRAVELLAHKFFIGTLFQPERSALDGSLHPLIAAFLRAVAPPEK